MKELYRNFNHQTADITSFECVSCCHYTVKVYDNESKVIYESGFYSKKAAIKNMNKNGKSKFYKIPS